MTVTATEFKTNMGRYLNMLSNDVIYITRNGKEIAMVSSPKVDRQALLDDLVGIIPDNEDIDENMIREERLNRQ
ncbi:MAG: type II toxin-antitoxin system Phd/YefM family antitoxin [Candidatus Weimeria sp.]